MDKFLKLITLNIEFNDSVSYRRVILICSILFATTLVFIFFGFLNLLLVQNTTVASLDFTAAFFSIFSIYHLKKYKNIRLSAKLATTNLMFFFLSFVYVNGSSHFALIWTIFLPIFAILVNGKETGFYFSAFFYGLLLTFAYLNIGIWQDGDWLLKDWIRLLFASSVLVYILYMNESSLEASDIMLTKTREKEKEYIAQLKEISITDQLTGLYNRRYYNEMSAKLLTLAKRNHLYITFFILDIDYFKNYNDRYGHMKGDEVLVEVATVIKEHIQRDDDFVFRLGGEEFAGIMLSQDPKKTHQWISSICNIIEELKIEHLDSNVSDYLTVSIGVSSIFESDSDNIENLYSHADKALYKAKDEGRNRTFFDMKSA